MNMLYKIKFPAGAVKGVLADALQMTLGATSKQFKYDPEGSTVEFTPTQLKAVILYLKQNKKWAEAEPEAFGDMIPDIDAALELIRKSVMESPNIAQASSPSDELVKRCEKFVRLATKK